MTPPPGLTDGDYETLRRAEGSDDPTVRKLLREIDGIVTGMEAKLGLHTGRHRARAPKPAAPRRKACRATARSDPGDGDPDPGEPEPESGGRDVSAHPRAAEEPYAQETPSKTPGSASSAPGMTPGGTS
jgi:hypothetical protein